MNSKKDNYYNPSNHTTYDPSKTTTGEKSEGNFSHEEPNERADHGKGKNIKSEKKTKAKKVKKAHSFKSFVAVAVIAVILAAGAGFGGGLMANRMGSSNDPATNVSGTGYNLKDATGSKLTVSEIADKTKGSVVEIQTESIQQDSWLRDYVTKGAGSGVVIKSNGYIVTNYHVVEGAQKISVRVDGKDYDATLVGSDASVDVAVLKINANNLKAITYGNSDQVNVGDMSVIIGNPLGSLGDSVSAGVISAKNREITLGDNTLSLLQTDASVNPGNSGGGMFNQHGQLIGIVVAKSSGENIEGIGFAIPVNLVAKVADEIMETGKSSNTNNATSTAYSGMAYLDIATESDAAEKGVSQTGIYVQSLLEENAKAAGFQPGDLVYSINGKKVSSLSELKSEITSKKPGDKIKYVVVRDNDRVNLTLTLMEKPATQS